MGVIFFPLVLILFTNYFFRLFTFRTTTMTMNHTEPGGGGLRNEGQQEKG